MSTSYDNPMVPVLGEYFPDDALTTASFGWPEIDPHDSYTIAPNSGLSIELDTHFPMRILSITLYNHAAAQSEALLTAITSAELSRSMAEASQLGHFVLDVTLSRPARLMIARMQIDNPSTGSAMRRACQTMIDANEFATKSAA
jgi:hypothetical protein